MELPITALFVGLLTFWYLRLSVRVIRQRRASGISVGTGEERDSDLFRAVRSHANFAEYIPLALLMVAVLEWHGLRDVYLYIFGASLVAGRYFADKGLMQRQMRSRIAGTIFTFLPLGVGVIFLLFIWVSRTFM